MWQTEYMIHERRKELLRVAAQVRLARQVRAERPPIIRWLMRAFANFRRPQRIEMETQHAHSTPCPELGRVS